MKRLVRLALVLSVLYGTGAHWAALQVYAWGTMKMAAKTDPCGVCRIVSKGTASETPYREASVPSADFAVPVPSAGEIVLSSVERPVPAPVSASSRSTPPATPPPDVFPA